MAVVENTIPLATKLVMGGCIMALQTIGSDAMPVFFALFGASIGTSFAPTMTRWRMAWQLMAVAIVCSLLGAWLGQRYFDNNLLSRCACAVLLAIFFYPLLNLIVGRVPSLFEEAARRRLGLPPKDSP